MHRAPQFVDAGHSQRFMEIYARLSQPRQEAHDWLATIYLLTLAPDVWARVKAFVNLDSGLINWMQINRLGWSEGERFLIVLASQCYGNLGKPELSMLWTTLTYRWFEAALFALRIRKYGGAEIDWEAVRAGVAHV